MAKRIHELAKEWGLQTKDLLAKAERAGLRGKKAQSSLTEKEAERLRRELGIDEPPSVQLGERVVGERVVVERDEAAEQVITARERTVEARIRPDVIRRRTRRVEVISREELPPLEQAPAVDGLDVPPPIDIPEETAPPIADIEVPPPAALPPLSEGEAKPEPQGPPAAAGQEPAEAAPEGPPVAAEAPPAEGDVSSVPAQAPVAAVPPAAAQAPAAATGSGASPPQTAAPRPEPEPRQPAPRRTEEPQRVTVLGRIDLSQRGPTPAAPPRLGIAEMGRANGEAARAVPPETGKPRRKKGRKVIKKQDMLDTLERSFRPGRMPRKRRAAPGKEIHKTEITVPRASKRVVRISEVISVGDLARAMGVKAGEVLRKLMDLGVMATINQALDADTATLVAAEFDYTVENVAFDAEELLGSDEEAADKAEQKRQPRPPVVTLMGHVDHGKTSLLDVIRKTDVAAHEAGGITQHIGAYSVDVGGRRITFLDTPGHEAFTAMRARGAKVTDIVVLVVAADDGVMPQTVEAINHARAAGVPIVVAINKIDKPDADKERVKKELADHGLVTEEWGGDTIVVPVSARTGEGVDQLLEMILLQAEILQLETVPDKRARGTIIEARLDRGRGPVATVLVQEGTLKVGDPFVCSTHYGRVRAMMDERGQRLEAAGASKAVEILGLSGVPAAGDAFTVVADEAKARQVAEHRRTKQRESEMAKTAKVSLEDLYQQVQAGAAKELRIVVKGDVQGSVEALSQSLARLSTDEVKLQVLHSSVGAITESDVLLASASNAVVIGFNVRPEPKVAAVAEREGVEIRLFNVIYEAVGAVREALEGLLEPSFKERVVGRAEVRQTFAVSGVGVVAGCAVVEGKIARGARARLLRDQVVVYEGRVSSLRRFKEDVREVLAGYECGVGLENFQDVKPGDVIEAFELEQVARRIPAPAGGRPHGTTAGLSPEGR